MNVSKILGLILFVFALPLLHASNDSNVWWVDDDNYGKTGLDGMSPETAFGTIQEAIDAETTSSGDTIKVLPGTYNQEYREIKDGDGNVLERNRIVIDKKLNIVAVGTKEETHIVGRHCPESEGGAADYGTGPTAVRCVRVAESGLGSMLSGFTIRDSATIDSTVTGAEDCGGSVSVENAAKDFFVTDCVISNSVCLRYGGTSYGGTFIRCLISDSRASNYSSALFSGNALFCVMAHCRLVNGSRNYYSLDNGDGSIVNCTIYGSTAARPSANGNYNCLFLGNNRSEINDAAEASNNVYASHGAAYRNADPVQLFAPALGDFRPLPGSDVFGAGAAKYLTTECPISLPEGFELLDMDGKKVDVSGEHVAAGAYQYPKTPKFGGVLLTADSTINGFPTYGTNQFYASAWPMQVKVSVVRFMHVSGYSDESEFSTRWPGKDGYVTITPPYAAGVVQTNTAASNANSRYVDAVNGNDTNNGAKDTPCATLQKVIDNYGSSGNPVVIYLAEGDYCIGGAEGRGVTNRFNLTNARWVKIIATGDRSKTIIRGAAAKNERDPVNYPGCGPDAVRCVNFSYNNSRYNHSVAFVGVTFADGHTDVGQNESYDMGGGVYGRPGKPGCLQFIDCVFTNCYAPAAGVGAQANFVRCRFIDCGGVTDGFRGSLLSSSLVEGGDFGTGALGSNTRAVGCTIASANAVAADASGLFVLNSIVSEGTKFPASAAIWGTTAYPCFADPVNGDYRPVSGSPALDVARRIFPKTDDPGWDDFTRYVSYLSTDDINRNKWICSGAYPIAGAYMDWVQGVSLFGEGCEWLTVSGASVGGNQLQPESKVTISRNPDAIRHWGVVVNGVTNYLDSGSAECVVGNGMNEGSIMPVLDQNWYVNPDPSIGDDGNNGFTPSTPKLTLNGALSVATNAGDVVHAAAGTYASGEIEYDYEAYTNKYNDVSFGSDPVRCEIAAGVRLVGDAGAEATILDGSGTHRGVLLNPGAVIQGFTIQNCKINGYGGAVHGVNDDDAVADCIVEDNVSGRFSIYMVKGVFRSRFYRNSADYGPVGSKVCLYNCLIGEGNKGRYCMFQNGTLDNCTVLGKLPASRKGIYFRNCLVVPTGQESGDKCSWWNSSYIGMQNGADNFHEGNEQVPADEMQFVDTVGGTPVIGKNCGVDRGDESLYFANYPSHLDPVIDGANRDLFGKPRIANGKLDRGCVEADWCGEYATTLGGGASFAVYSASSNVTNANGFVALPNGSELTAVWRVPAGMTASCSFSFRNTGAGTLYVTVNGETVAYGPSEETRIVRFCCMSAADTVSLKYEAGEDSEGCAEIFGFAGYRGLRLTIR